MLMCGALSSFYVAVCQFTVKGWVQKRNHCVILYSTDECREILLVAESK